MLRGSPPAVLSIANWQSWIWAFIGIPIFSSVAMGAGWHLGAIYLVVVALAFVWLFYRCLRMGVRFDGHGVTVRRFLRTDHLRWAEIRHFADGHARVTVAEKTSSVWALAVVLNDGRAITVNATAARGNPRVLAAITKVATRHHIPVQLTGKIPLSDSRASRGPLA